MTVQLCQIIPLQVKSLQKVEPIKSTKLNHSDFIVLQVENSAPQQRIKYVVGQEGNFIFAQIQQAELIQFVEWSLMYFQNFIAMQVNIHALALSEWSKHVSVKGSEVVIKEI